MGEVGFLGWLSALTPRESGIFEWFESDDIFTYKTCS